LERFNARAGSLLGTASGRFPLAVLHQHGPQAQALERLGRDDEALAALVTAEQLSRGNSKPTSLRGYILARRGQADLARAVLAGLQERSRTRYVPPYAFALIHAGLAERELVFARLGDAAAGGDVHQIFLTVDAKWDPFRTDPRFTKLLQRFGSD
jgi:hypothetical protein